MLETCALTTNNDLSKKKLGLRFGSLERTFHLRAAANTQYQQLHFSCCGQRPIPLDPTLLSFLAVPMYLDCFIKCNTLPQWRHCFLLLLSLTIPRSPDTETQLVD
jgi:hypothetical protein